MKGCPICLGNYTDIKSSELVCVLHEKWVVTTCSECGVVSFSNCAGFCMLHGRDKPKPFTKGSGDHRACLRGYGLEGWK